MMGNTVQRRAGDRKGFSLKMLIDIRYTRCFERVRNINFLRCSLFVKPIVCFSKIYSNNERVVDAEKGPYPHPFCIRGGPDISRYGYV